PVAHAGNCPAAAKGFSAARGFCRRRRGDRRAVKHARFLIRLQARPRHRKLYPPLRAAIERNMGGVERMGSTTLRLWRLAIYLPFTLLLMPVQAIGLALGQRWVVGFPRFYHRCCCYILGLRVLRIGRATATRPVLFAANHVSYLDITIFGSLIAGSFIAKHEGARWPLFGWLAKLQRSVFIDRQVRSTADQRDSIAARLAAKEALILFPEGTSGDGNRVLPFKSALFSVADHAATGPVMVQ